jgi:hypothetical protein
MMYRLTAIYFASETVKKVHEDIPLKVYVIVMTSLQNVCEN